MIRQILLGGTAAVLVAGSASALTMNVTGDNRAVEANAFAGDDGDMQLGPAPASNIYDEQVNASASANNQLLTQNLGSGGGGGGFFGAVANAGAGQFSEIGALSISGSGFAEASGNHGDIPDFSDADGSGGGGGLSFDGFAADAQSVLDVLFSIDEAAAFDLSGFLAAGNELSDGPIGNDISNAASAVLVNTDTDTAAFKTKVSNDSTILDESGVLAAGNYRFTVRADASVQGFGDNSCIGCGSFTVAPIDVRGYATSAGYRGVALELSAIDKPIPEPVTTTLAAMGLGALVLRTSRRRHS